MLECRHDKTCNALNRIVELTKENKELKTQKRISDTLHTQGSEKIEELREELLRRRNVMKNCSRCSWQVD